MSFTVAQIADPQGTKIDNLVHVAHNVVIDRHCLVMGQVGLAGSNRLGDYVVVASHERPSSYPRMISLVGAVLF